MSRGLRALKRIKDFLVLNTKHWKQDVGYIEKELKALEIIKEKKVNIILLISSFNNHITIRYYNSWFPDKLKLTQEEYDLLKEVLL